MAHEALKFNIITDDTTHWQPIAGSQDFGTFYMVYIRFTKVIHSENKYHYFAEFKLQNYKGPISIGFESTPILRELTEEEKSNRNLKLKTLISKFEEESPENQERLLEEHRLDFTLDINVRPFDLDDSIAETKLAGISKEFKNAVLETTLNAVSPDGALYDPKKPLKSRYINPDHYERSGDEVILVGRKNKDSTDPFNHLGAVGTLLTKCNPSRSYLR